MSKFTPGPWHLSGKDSIGTYIEGRYEHSNIATINTVDQENRNERESNARLIAAAPELLEALEVILKNYISFATCGICGYGGAEREEEVIAAKSAIAKARGE